MKLASKPYDDHDDPFPAAGGVMNLLVASNAGAQEFRVKGGTQQISENLFREIGEKNVLFEHPVLTIDQVRLG